MSSNWKPADYVFETRPRAAVIKGRKARNRRPLLLAPVHQPAEGEPEALTVVAGKVGFVVDLADGEVLLALPKSPGAAPADLTALQRIPHQVLRIKWSQFESQFDVAG
ncbi:MAG TPA: hypothetical protein VFW49_06860 [Fluviicoccus sp.]|nr:hypothetical protein [Fluviicoccus sp.]